MLTQSAAPTQGRLAPSLPHILQSAWRFSPPLTVFTAASLLLTLAGAAGMLIDPRIVLGMPNWAKSTKFGISLSLYGATLLWMMPLLTDRPRLGRLLAHSVGVLLTIEIVLLVIQAIRGVPMHFNVATPFDEALWQIMGGTIMVFWLMTLVGTILMLFQRLPDRVLAWGLRLGLLITLVGLAQGFLMSGPNATQQEALRAGQQLDLVGAHTVGALDGGPGLPLLGWSTDHGDLRIGHFVGIHGVQVLALLGLLLSRLQASWLGTGHRQALVATGAAGYFGLVVLVTWQALRDQPLLAPDGLTLAALAALSGAVTAAAGAVLAHARTRRS